MEFTELGSTGLKVSRLCYGTGAIGGVTKNLPDRRGADLLEYAFDRGVTFWDTAESYDSYRHIRLALRTVARAQVVINTKTGGKTKSAGRASVRKALEEMEIQRIDAIMLHAVQDPADFEARRGCLEALLEAKDEGTVGHVGASSHVYTGPVLETLIGAPEIEVVLSHLNMKGRGLEGGSQEAHTKLLRRLHGAGKGVMIMKLLDAGKAPASEAGEWISWGFEFPHAHSVDLGMASEDEIDLAVGLASGVKPKSPAGTRA